ncbi:MAG TPA: PRD domain-containing protein, partial [Lachnospiraceae bacterium]|nr:PRD domain-containing protein [Lachnospiraceae bacterium]
YSKKLNVSTKTLQSDLKKIRSFLKKYEIRINAVSGKGILLLQKNRVREQLLNAMRPDDRKENEESSGERRNSILKNMLLHTNELTSIHKLSEQYFVGKTSIVNDMKTIEKWLEKYNLELSKTKEGTCVKGSEINIRKAIAGLAIRENARSGLQELFEKEDIDFIEELLYDVEKKNLDISDVYYANLLTHILICIKRVRENIHIEENETSYMVNAETVEQYQKASEIGKRIDEHYGIQIKEGEVYYIYQYLISSGVEKKTDTEEREWNRDDKSLRFAKELTGLLSERFGIRFEQDTDMMQGLLLHIRPMINRLEYNIQIQNPLKEDITRQYPEMVKSCGEILAKLAVKYDLKQISLDEAVNIAIYYQTMLEKKVMKKQVIVVCHSGYGTSQLLAAKLQNAFAFLKIVDVVSSRKIKDMDLSGIDFIITTVPIERKDVPHIVVSSLLSGQDIKAIRNCFAGQRE